MSDAKRIADVRLAEGTISLEEHDIITSRIAAQPESDARNFADQRLAKGEISAEQHASIVAALSGVAAIKNHEPQKTTAKGWGNYTPYLIGAAIALVALFVVYKPDNGYAASCISQQPYLAQGVSYINSCDRPINTRVCWAYIVAPFTCRGYAIPAGGEIEHFARIIPTRIKVAACKENFGVQFVSDTSESGRYTCTSD